MGTPVVKDTGRTIMMALVLGTTGIVGLALGVAGYFFEWGFCAYTPAFVLVLGGFAGMISMFTRGGVWKGSCPSCGATLRGETGETVVDDKMLCCPSCSTWVMGKTELEVVPDDHVHEFPVFRAPLREPIHWPDGCPVCGGEVTRTVKVEGRSALGTAAAVVAPVSVQRVLVIQAPACDAHDDGVWASRDGEDEDTSDEVAFRSFEYFRRFVAMNAGNAEA